MRALASHPGGLMLHPPGRRVERSEGRSREAGSPPRQLAGARRRPSRESNQPALAAEARGRVN